MAGDRGLAFVIVSLILLGAMWMFATQTVAHDTAVVPSETTTPTTDIHLTGSRSAPPVAQKRWASKVQTVPVAVDPTAIRVE